MLELLVLKKYAECTSRRVKWTSGARDLTIFFQQLAGPMFLKLLDFYIVFFTISFRKTSRPMFLKQDGANCFLNRSGLAPTCISAFPVHERVANLVCHHRAWDIRLDLGCHPPPLAVGGRCRPPARRWGGLRPPQTNPAYSGSFAPQTPRLARRRS